MRDLIGKPVRIEWRRPEDDWPTFTVLAYVPPMLHLQGRDNGEWKHRGDTFWVNIAEIVSIVPEDGQGGGGAMRYTYNGIKVPQHQALSLWLASRTYERAAYRDAIWPNAHRSDSPHHRTAIVHLEEAGIRILPPHPREGGGVAKCA